MCNALAVSQARSKLGRLADQAVKGKSVYLKRGTHLLRLERVNGKVGIPARPVGYFKFDDDLTELANPSSSVHEAGENSFRGELILVGWSLRGELGARRM